MTGRGLWHRDRLPMVAALCEFYGLPPREFYAMDLATLNALVERMAERAKEQR